MFTIYGVYDVGSLLLLSLLTTIVVATLVENLPPV